MKKNVAIIWGGYTSEIVVSEKSMAGIHSFLDRAEYNIYKVKIARDSWTVDVDGKSVDMDKNDFSFIRNGQKIEIDFACITIHGTPGEDGRLQGYFDMLGIPYSSCGVTASALTMNKFICNRYLSCFGIITATSILLRDKNYYNTEEIVEQIKFPMFVKPNLGGSSFATFKVTRIEQLQPAVDAAFNEANEVVVESFIKGREVTCGCYRIGEKMTALPLTEVVTANDFFDYDAKYNGQVEEITPARVGDELTACIQQQTIKIYDLIGAKGIIRADYIIENDVPYLLEVNTTPGMTETSFIPQQVAAAGLDITRILSDIIDEELKKKH